MVSLAPLDPSALKPTNVTFRFAEFNSYHARLL
jgi:hypothetical protein